MGSFDARSYYLLMYCYGTQGYEGLAYPDMTREQLVAYATNAYEGLAWIEWRHDGIVEDITNEILRAAGILDDNREIDAAEMQDARFDHERDLHKHGVTQCRTTLIN